MFAHQTYVIAMLGLVMPATIPNSDLAHLPGHLLESSCQHLGAAEGQEEDHA